MTFTNDFFIQAQGVIERTFRAHRDELLKLSGNIATDIKHDSTVVTHMDRQLEAEITEALRGFDKTIGIEGEEFGASGSRETYWLVDPIDGTQSFTRGTGQFRNMVTLIDSGKPLFAVVYRPVFDELYVAAEGDGTYCNGKPMKVSQRPLHESYIEIFAPGSRADTWKIMQKLAQKVSSVRMSGDFLSVVNGGFEALLVHQGPGGPWDYAPRALLIKESGGRVENLDGSDYDLSSNNFLAASPTVFDELMEIVNGA